MLFVVYHIYRINDNAIALALQIETINSKSLQVEEDNPDDDELVFVENPRKITLFRVVMEKKLGIDWEHGPRHSDEITELSLNTDMV